MSTDLLALLSPKNIILFIVIFTRLGGLMVSAPLFSSYPIPGQVKAWLIATITFIIFPFILAKTGFQMPTSIPELTVILLKEFMVGYIIGFLTSVIFIGIEMASELISIQMGLSMAQALNPTTGETAPVLAQAYAFIAAMVFLGINGHQQLFSAVYQSFQSVPIGYDFVLNGMLVKQIIYVTSQMFAIAVSVALPVFAVLFATDVLLGFTAKMMPQMNIFMVAMPLKIYIGLLLITMLMHPTMDYIVTIMSNFINGIRTLF